MLKKEDVPRDVPIPLVASVGQQRVRHQTLLNALEHGIDARARSLRKKAAQLASENEKKFARLGLDAGTAIARLQAAVDAAAGGADDDLLAVDGVDVPRVLAKVILAREQRRARFVADAALCDTVDAKSWQQRMIAAGWRSLVPLSPGEKVVLNIVTVSAALGSYEKWRLQTYMVEGRPKPLSTDEKKAKKKDHHKKKEHHKKDYKRERLPPAPVYDSKPKVTRHNVVAPNGYASQQVAVASLFMDNLSGKKRSAPSSHEPRKSKPRIEDDRKELSRPWERKVDPQKAPKPTKVKFSD